MKNSVPGNDLDRSKRHIREEREGVLRSNDAELSVADLARQDVPDVLHLPNTNY